MFRQQFIAGDAVFEGTMDVVWHRPAWIRPLLSLLARGGLLFPETGRAVPARLSIARLDAAHDWRRSFRFRRERRLDAVLLHDRRRGCVVERVGRLDLDWRIDFCPPATLEIATTRTRVAVGSWRISLPRAIAPAVSALEIATGPDSVWVAVTARLPGLGPFFGYSGSFGLAAGSGAADAGTGGEPWPDVPLEGAS